MNREVALKKVKRFSIYKRMIYRTNLFMHSKRTLWILKGIMPYVRKAYQINEKKAEALALIHDDVEIITGDYQLALKLNFSEKQKMKLKNMEEQSVPQLVQFYGRDFLEFDYASLLLETIRKNTIESQIVSFCDKMDAFGEILHELFAGNEEFAEKKIGHVVSEEYRYYLVNLKEKFPLITKLFDINFLLFKPSKNINAKMIAENGFPHSVRTAYQDTGYFHYDYWKYIIITHGKVDWLVNAKEN